MKKFLCIIAIGVLAALCAGVMASCGDSVKEEGNKVVSNAKDYLKSELGVEGNPLESAKDYLKDELGLNNTSNEVIEGTWTQEDETNGNWEWTFDGKNKCTLKGITTGFNGSGTYSVDEDAKTVTVSLNEWDNQKVYTYTLRQTLSDTMLELKETYSSYKQNKKK